MDCNTPGFPVHHPLLELVQIHVHWIVDAIQLSHPLSSPSLPAFNLSQHQGLFQGVSSLHQVAKVLEFQLHHQSLSEYSGLISFRADWLELFVVQGNLKSLLQHHSQKHQLFGTQLSLWCNSRIHTRLLSIPLTRWTFVSKVMPLLFNMLSRLVITFLPRSKQSPPAVILKPKK